MGPGGAGSPRGMSGIIELRETPRTATDQPYLTEVEGMYGLASPKFPTDNRKPSLPRSPQRLRYPYNNNEGY